MPPTPVLLWDTEASLFREEPVLGPLETFQPPISGLGVVGGAACGLRGSEAGSSVAWWAAWLGGVAMGRAP